METYGDDLRLIGKRVMDFLLALIKLFGLVLRLMRYERISVQNRRFRSNGGRLTQNFRYNGSPTPTILLLIRGLDDLSYCVKNLDRSLFRFVTMHAFGSQTDRQRGKNEMDETN